MQLNLQGFMAGAELCGDGKCLALEALPPFLRVLLTTDGTVTKSIEAYFAESVAIANVRQMIQPKKESAESMLTASRNNSENFNSAGELLRTVDLVGRKSAQVYARASSIVDVEQLPPHLSEGLQAGEIGIGELVRSGGLATFRQMKDLGLRDSDHGIEIWRTYSIYLNDLPVIQITEWFPLDIYKNC